MRFNVCLSIFISCTLLSLSALADEPIEVRRDLLAPLTTWQVWDWRGPVSFSTVQVSHVPTSTHTQLSFHFAEGVMELRLTYDEQVLRRPGLLLRDAALFGFMRDPGGVEMKGVEVPPEGLLNAIGPAATDFGFYELLENVAAGSVPAKVRWLRWRLAVLERLKVSDGFEAQFPGTRAELAALVAEDRKDVSELQTRWRREARRARREQQVASPQSSAATGERDTDLRRLEQMILANDRQGVAELFRAKLPWEKMEPAEVRTWRVWLEAIEFPDRKKAVFAFRGIGYRERILRMSKPNGDVLAFASPLISRATERNRPLFERLASLRQTNGDAERPYISEPGVETVVKISDQMHQHSNAKSASSIFISLTPRLDVAERFVSGTDRMPGAPGALLVVRMDPRRLIPNLATTFKEMEYLAPLIIFPDEVVHFQERYEVSEAGYERFLREVKQRTGADLSDLVERMGPRFRPDAFKFFATMQEAARPIVRSCVELF